MVPAERQRRGAAMACDGKQLLAARAAAWHTWEGQQEGGEAVGELGGDAWRSGEAGGPRAARHGGQRRHYRQRENKGRGGGR
jgi:hypothetical protein